MADTPVDKPRKVFTEEQVARYRRVFNMFDINKNGALELRELAAVAKVLGYRLPKEHVFAILTQLDMDENGSISFEEFLYAMPGNLQVIPEEEHKFGKIVDTFKKYERHGAGYITTEDAVTALLKDLGFMEFRELNLFELTNTNVENTLSFTDFDTFYLRVKELKAEIRHKFQEYDKNGDGFVSKEEAYEVLQKELGFTEFKSLNLLNQFDYNTDGQLSYDEFVGFYLKIKEKKESIAVAFKQFDKDQKGYVSLDDAKRILGGLLFTDEEVEALLKAHDENQDGVLQFDEFVHFWSA